MTTAHVKMIIQPRIYVKYWIGMAKDIKVVENIEVYISASFSGAKWYDKVRKNACLGCPLLDLKSLIGF